MLASVHSEPVRFSSAGITSLIFSSIEAMTASSQRLTCVSPDFTTSSSGTAFACLYQLSNSVHELSGIDAVIHPDVPSAVDNHTDAKSQNTEIDERKRSTFEQCLPDFMHACGSLRLAMIWRETPLFSRPFSLTEIWTQRAGIH
jgi:hypothetical protein